MSKDLRIYNPTKEPLTIRYMERCLVEYIIKNREFPERLIIDLETYLMLVHENDGFGLPFSFFDVPITLSLDGEDLSLTEIFIKARNKQKLARDGK